MAALAPGAIGAGHRDQAPPDASSTSEIPPFSMAVLGHALLCLLIGTVLGSALAFRPRRPGAPPRGAQVIQAQVMLAIVGCLVMLVVGASLARAFGVAGAAGLVRYRAKIEDPKDASVMLSCLAIGLASGVGLFYIAAAGMAFTVVVLWVLEWNEPWPAKYFDLKVTAKDPPALRQAVEGLLARYRVHFELRSETAEELSYAVEMPQGRRTEPLSEEMVHLDGTDKVSVSWAEKKAPK